MLELFWEWRQQQKITDAESAALRAQSKAADVQFRLSQAERKIEALSVMTMALGSLLRDRLGVSEAEIDARVREIDLSDGVLDGRAGSPVSTRSLARGPEGAAQPRACLSCNRRINPIHTRCFYCGGELAD